MNARTTLLGTAVAALLIAGGLAACSKSGTDDAGNNPAMGKDFKLTSETITLPSDADEEFPAGPGAEAINNNCRACHSPSMVLVQPPLTHEEWVAEVDKMRNTFKAPIDEAAIPDIIAYLDGYSAKLKQSAGGTPAAP